MLRHSNASTQVEPIPVESASKCSSTLRAWTALGIDLILIFVAAYFILVVNLGAHSLAVSDEVHEVGAAQEMALTGSWFTPTIQGRPFFDKPPFKMWLTSMLVAVVGPSNAAFRSLDVAFGIGTLVLTYALSRMLFASRLVGLIAVFSLLGCRIFVLEHGMRHAVQDSLLVFLSTAVIVCAWKFELAVRTARQSWRPLIYALACGTLGGFAILTKSAAALMPFIIFGCYLLVTGKLVWVLRSAWKPLLAGGVVAVTLASTYFLSHCLLTPGACSNMLYYHVYRRVNGGVHNNISGPWFYLIRLVPHRAAFVPEVLGVSLVWGCAQWWNRRDARFALLVCGSVLPVALYSLASTKFSWYIAPAFPFMAILIAATLVAGAAAVLPVVMAWIQGRSALPVRAALGALLVLYGFGSSAVSYAKSIEVVAGRTGRIALDLFAEDVLKFQAEQGREPRIVSYQQPRSAIDELNYENILRPFTAVVAESQLPAVLSGEAPDFVLTGPHQVKQFASRWPIRDFMVLPPIRNRMGWTVALAFQPDTTYRHLSSQRTLIDFGFQDLATMYGLGGPERLHGLGVRFVLGDSAAIAVPGNALYELLGGELALNAAPQFGNARTPMLLRVSINTEELPPLILVSGGLSTYHQRIPEQWIRAGTNTLTFRLELDGKIFRPTDRSLMLNWVSLRIPLNEPVNQPSSD